MVEVCLREDAAQLGFAGLGLAGFVLAGSALGLARGHGHAGPVDGDVHLGHGVKQDDLARQGCPALATGDLFNLRADGLRDPFDLLGLDDDAGQLFEVQAAFVERLFAPHAGHQAPHPRGECG